MESARQESAYDDIEPMLELPEKREPIEIELSLEISDSRLFSASPADATRLVLLDIDSLESSSFCRMK